MLCKKGKPNQSSFSSNFSFNIKAINRRDVLKEEKKERFQRKEKYEKKSFFFFLKINTVIVLVCSACYCKQFCQTLIFLPSQYIYTSTSHTCCNLDFFNTIHFFSSPLCVSRREKNVIKKKLSSLHFSALSTRNVLDDSCC